MRSISAAVACVLLLGGCATTRRPAPPPHAGVPGVKIGRPYTVLGRSYVPADDVRYNVTGIASWYGPTFHGLSTANGETYDQDGLTAAHKTLPMPSWVEVSNLDNGRVLTVRINDRGPFVDGRIIDLSRKSAQLLGVDRPGTARVRVRRVFPGAAEVAALAPPSAREIAALAPPPSREGAVPLSLKRGRNEVEVPHPLPGEVAAQPTEGAGAAVTAVAIPGATPGAVYVQVAALADAGRAAWLAGFLAPIGAVVTERSPNGLTRVRLGPYIDAATATPILARVRDAGYSAAQLVTPQPGSP